jgi:hypothetical protein
MSAVGPFDLEFARLSFANDLAEPILLVVFTDVYLRRVAHLDAIVPPDINDVAQRVRLDRAVGRLAIFILKRRVRRCSASPATSA